MDIKVLLDAFGAAVDRASYLTRYEKSKYTPRISYYIS